MIVIVVVFAVLCRCRSGVKLWPSDGFEVVEGDLEPDGNSLSLNVDRCIRSN